MRVVWCSPGITEYHAELARLLPCVEAACIFADQAQCNADARKLPLDRLRKCLLQRVSRDKRQIDAQWASRLGAHRSTRSQHPSGLLQQPLGLCTVKCRGLQLDVG